VANSDASGRAQTLLTTNRTTTVSATAGVRVDDGWYDSDDDRAQTGKVTVTVNTTAVHHHRRRFACGTAGRQTSPFR